MKKVYLSPEMQIVTFATVDSLADTLPILVGSGDAGSSKSPRHYLYDDEEEEEFEEAITKSHKYY